MSTPRRRLIFIHELSRGAARARRADCCKMFYTVYQFVISNLHTLTYYISENPPQIFLGALAERSALDSYPQKRDLRDNADNIHRHRAQEHTHPLIFFMLSTATGAVTQIDGV